MVRLRLATVVLTVLIVAAVGSLRADPLPPTIDLETAMGDVVAFGAEPDDLMSGVLVGDFNGDGSGDALLVAGGGDGPGNTRSLAGEAYLTFGPFSAGTTLDMALGDQDVTIYGAEAGDYLSHLGVGDVNNDGIDDILLGAIDADGPANSRYGAGEVYVILGSPALSSTSTIDIALGEQDFTVYGADPSDQLSNAHLMQVADVNDDGFGDMLIGCYHCDGPGNSRGESSGELHVIFGPPAAGGSVDLALREQDLTIYGDQSGDALGIGVGSGDVNDDGIDDILVGAPHGDGPGNTRPDGGDVYVVFGSASLGGTIDTALDQQDLTVYGPGPAGLVHITHGFGYNRLETGDLNGDTIRDLFIQHTNGDGPGGSRPISGEAYIVFGPVPPSGSVDVVLGEYDAVIYGAEAGDLLFIGTPHDINDDGFVDFSVAAVLGDGPGNTRTDAGEGYIFFGPLSAGALDLASNPQDVTVYGAQGDNEWVPFLEADLNGDGGAEIVATSRFADGPGDTRPDAGEAHVFFGEAVSVPPSTPTKTFTPTPTKAYTPTPTSTPGHPTGVGGTVMLPPGAIAADSGVQAEGSGWSGGVYAALGGMVVVIAVGGWYARRRWLR